MIVNVWSTPRTGSVWYSMHLAETMGYTRVTEMFNPRHMDLYRTIKDGHIFNYREYVSDECRYEEYYLDDEGMLKTKPVYARRERNLQEEFEYRKGLIQDMSPDNKLIMHNHVYPIDSQMFNFLTAIADKNIYTYRKDKKAQLASYAIATVNKMYAKFTANSFQYDTIDVDQLPLKDLENLVHRINVWNSVEKEGDILAYEDIPFYEKEGMIYKQVQDYTQILTKSACDELDHLVSRITATK